MIYLEKRKMVAPKSINPESEYPSEIQQFLHILFCTKSPIVKI